MIYHQFVIRRSQVGIFGLHLVKDDGMPRFVSLIGWLIPRTRLHLKALVSKPPRVPMVLRRLPADELRQVREQVAARVAPFSDSGGIELPAVSLVASAS